MLLQFLQPIELWAAAGIIIPVIIHLWNIKQGKTLQVGSIALIIGSAKSRARSFKLTQWLLLLLRCLLLVAIAILIAKPYYYQGSAKQEQGWIVIEPSGLINAYRAYKPVIDSLQKKGFTVHYFDTAFNAAYLKDTSQTIKNTASNNRLSYWTLLKILDEKTRAGLPVYLFTDNLLHHFSGLRPALNLHLQWHTYPSQDTAATWLVKAYQTTTDSIRIASGKSTAAGTSYSYQNVLLNSGNDIYKVRATSGGIVVNSNSLHQTITTDTATLVIIIYANKYGTDAAYVKAALNAIQAFTQRKIQVTVVQNIAAIPSKHDWLFWLSDDNIPAYELKKNVLLYEKGEAINGFSALIPGNKTSLTTIGKTTLYKSIKATSSKYQTIWKNGYGEPVLSVQKGSSNIYHFYTHFNPQWSDLVWSPAFPQSVYELLYNSNTNNNAVDTTDKRMIDYTQMQPKYNSMQKNSSSQTQQNKKDFAQIIWLMVVGLFLLERVVSLYK